MDFYLTTSASTFPCFQISWRKLGRSTLYVYTTLSRMILLLKLCPNENWALGICMIVLNTCHILEFILFLYLCVIK